MIDKNVKQYSEQLNKLGIEHSFMEHPEMVDVADIYQYFGLDSSTGLSTLVMKADEEFVAVIRRDDCRLDYEKMKQVLEVRNLAIASDTEFEKLTGLPHGAAHLLNPVKITLLDNQLFEKEYLMGGSGSLSVTIKYRSADLKKIPGMKIVDVADVKKQPEILSGKRIVSGITPSGDGTLHIGNYLGAVKQFIEIAKNNECFLFVADYHALTTVQNKEQLEKNVENLILNELALLHGSPSISSGKPSAGSGLNNIIFYRQSDIGLHPELQTIINNVTPLGLLKRAHAYKDKLQKDVMEDDINLGLFNYPVLMAADILMYKPDFVPVGKDQKQHVEITRDIAERFNKIYGPHFVKATGRNRDIFPLPEAYIPEEVASVLGTDGKRKMSKSIGNIISIFEPEAVIRKQVMSCFTDPTRAHANDPGHVEGNMVFAYLEHFGERQIVDEFKEAYVQGKVADVEIKEYLFKCLMDKFAPARKRYEELKNNPKLVTEILENGTSVARKVAGETMKEVREAIGLINKYTLSKTVGLQDSKNVRTEASKSDKISIDDFGKVEIRVGKVEKAENVEKSEKLIKLTVDFGSAFANSFGETSRTIYTGVRGYGYKPEDFTGKQFMFVVNLVYRKMPGGESQGMILAVDGLEKPFGEHGDVKPVFVSAEGLPIGSKVR
jgi:tryptophanyl-tRNA synthetase